jgi:hypothetical protein
MIRKYRENQIKKVSNEVWESNNIIRPCEKNPIGGVNGRTIQGANPEYVKIKTDTCVYIPIFI